MAQHVTGQVEVGAGRGERTGHREEDHLAGAQHVAGPDPDRPLGLRAHHLDIGDPVTYCDGHGRISLRSDPAVRQGVRATSRRSAPQHTVRGAAYGSRPADRPPAVRGYGTAPTSGSPADPNRSSAASCASLLSPGSATVTQSTPMAASSRMDSTTRSSSTEAPPIDNPPGLKQTVSGSPPPPASAWDRA